MTAIDTAPAERLVKDLSAAQKKLGDLDDVNQAAAVLILRASEPYMPRRTGSLASGHVVTAGRITNQRRYAVPVFAGYRRGRTVVAGRPWLVKGEAAAHDKAVDLYVDRINDTLGKV